MRSIFLCALALAAAAANAQSFPARPVRFIVTYPPGALNDLIARTLAPQLASLWRQQVIVDNRPGGGTLIGSELAARAAPDGHTLLLVAIAHAMNPSVYAKLPYDSVRDFAPVSQIASSPYILITNPGVPAKSVKELVALAKAKPGQLPYGSTGTGGSSHLMGVMLGMMANVDIVHVPYKGLAPALTDMIGGQINFGFGSYSTVGQHIKANRLRALAITTAKRNAAWPDIPTVSEAGLPAYQSIAWYGMVAPRGLPQPVLKKLSTEVSRIIQSKDVRENLSAQGADPVGGTPAEFGAFIKAEMKRYEKVVKDAGVTSD